jgi:hypothetical protein
MNGEPSSARRITALTAGAAVIVGLAAGLGFVLGSDAAPTDEQARAERRQGFAAALEDAKSEALQRSRPRGLIAGRKVGQAEARRVAKRRGSSDGSSEAEAKLAAIAQEEAEAAARAEAEERAENCGAPLFTPGYCPTDEEIEQEGLAESLCGPGDPALEQEAAEQGIQCRPR